MLNAIKFMCRNLKGNLSFAFCILLIAGSVSCIAGISSKTPAVQRQEFLLNRHIKNNRLNIYSDDHLSATQPSVMRSGKKALRPVGQVLSKVILVCLNTFPGASDKAPEYSYGSRIFEIVPCNDYYLQIGTLLI